MTREQVRAAPARPPAIRHPTLLVALLLLSIGVRALVGYAGCYACPKVAMLMAALALAAFGGKALGGIISDRLGWLETSVVALLLSVPFIAFGNGNLIVIVAGLFLFQVTMPVTVSAIALVYPGRPGFAFGLSAAAFIIGAVATFFAPVKALYGAWVFFVLILISAGAVYWGLRLLGDENPCRGFLTKAREAVVEPAPGP